jgi:hypothetical protein
MLEVGKVLAVFSIRAGKNGSVWVRAGSAEVNRDGSMNLQLDVLPLDGRLHVRESHERRDDGPRRRQEPSPPATH